MRLTAQTCRFLRLDAASFFPTVVRSAPRAGQAHTPRRRFLPVVALALGSVGGYRRSAARIRRTTLVAARARRRDHGAVALRGARPLCARSSPRRRERAARTACTERAAVAAGGARGSAAADPHRAPQHCGRRALARAAASRALRTGRRRAARDRARLEEPRRRDDEPRQPVAHVAGRARTISPRSRRAKAQLAVGGARPAPTRGRARRCDARRAGVSRRARAGTCAARRVHRLARRAAPDDAQRDRRGRRTRTTQLRRRQRRSSQPTSAPVTRSVDLGRPRRRRSRPACAHRRRDRLRARRADATGLAGRLGRRRRRPVGDPARHAHDGARLRRGGRRGHRRRGARRGHRPVVPDGRAGPRLGPAHGDDRPASNWCDYTSASCPVAQAGSS